MEKVFELKISAPELVEAIKLLAETMEKIKVMGQVRNANVSGSDVEEKHEQPKTELEPVTLEAVRAKLAEISKAGKYEQVKALIEKYGVSKLTEVPKEKYSELLKEAGKC
jgi:hypothetical protein